MGSELTTGQTHISPESLELCCVIFALFQVLQLQCDLVTIVAALGSVIEHGLGVVVSYGQPVARGAGAPAPGHRIPLDLQVELHLVLAVVPQGTDHTELLDGKREEGALVLAVKSSAVRLARGEV